MKVKIKQAGHLFGFTFFVPLFVLKWKCINKVLTETAMIQINFAEIYQELKKTKRRHGSFVLVEAFDHDGDSVKITL